MEKVERCDCKMKSTRLVWIVDWLCGALLIGITAWVACHYAAMPDKIPTHFGADGVIDGYGGKSMIWCLLAIRDVGYGTVSKALEYSFQGYEGKP